MTDGPAVTYCVQKGYQAMTHPSLVEKPALTVADLHLIGKLINEAVGDLGLTTAECQRLDDLYVDLDDYLTLAVAADWPETEALVG